MVGWGVIITPLLHRPETKEKQNHSKENNSVLFIAGSFRVSLVIELMVRGMLEVLLEIFMLSRPTLACSHWRKFVCTEYHHDIIMCRQVMQRFKTQLHFQKLMKSFVECQDRHETCASKTGDGFCKEYPVKDDGVFCVFISSHQNWVV